MSASEPAPLLKLDGLSVDLLDPGTGRFVCVLRDVSLVLRQGQVVGITGPSGGGKSTLVAAISGLLPISARVRVTSFEIRGRPAVAPGAQAGSTWNQRVRRALGLAAFTVSQDARSILFPNRTVRWHLSRAARSQIQNESPLETLASLGFTPAEKYLSRFPAELSTGECQRVQWAIARRLNLDVLLMDEPFSSVSEDAADMLADQVRARAQSGCGILLVSHQLKMLHIVAGEVLTISDGRVLQHGPVGTLLEVTHDTPDPPASLRDTAAPWPPFVRIQDLGVRLADTVVFQNSHFHVPLRSRTGLLGPSGAGKTTLARVILGLVAPSSGSVDRLPATHPHWSGMLAPATARQVWKQIQIVIQDTDLAFDPACRLGDSLTQVARASRPELSQTAAWRLAGTWLARFGLGESAILAPPMRLSGGEKRRAAIVQSLLALGVADEVSTSPDGDERLLILDEPTVGLDRFWQHSVARELQQLQESLKLTLLVISHDRRFVRDFCNNVTEWT